MEILLSIIIPYYETFDLTIKLLKELSLQRNKNKKIEIIVIDDYCKNEFSSYKVACDDILRNGDIIVINHEKNYGVSKSRNDGLKIAKGKYIAFCDADDMVMPNYIDTLLELIETRDEDIIYFNWLDINTNEVNRMPQNCAVWKSIYKKDILPRFNENLKAREDYYFQEEINKTEHTRYYYDKVLYVYNSGRENSLSWKDRKGEL